MDSDQNLVGSIFVSVCFHQNGNLAGIRFRSAVMCVLNYVAGLACEEGFIFVICSSTALVLNVLSPYFKRGYRRSLGLLACQLLVG